MLISVKLPTKKRYNNLCITFGTWKVRRLNQSRSKVAPKAKFLAGLGEKNGWAVPNWKQAFLINSDAELFMYLIQCIRLGSWKVQRLRQVLDVLEEMLQVNVFKWKLCRLDFQSSDFLMGHDVGTWMRLFKQ